VFQQAAGRIHHLADEGLLGLQAVDAAAQSHRIPFGKDHPHDVGAFPQGRDLIPLGPEVMNPAPVAFGVPGDVGDLPDDRLPVEVLHGAEVFPYQVGDHRMETADTVEVVSEEITPRSAPVTSRLAELLIGGAPFVA